MAFMLHRNNRPSNCCPAARSDHMLKKIPIILFLLVMSGAPLRAAGVGEAGFEAYALQLEIARDGVKIPVQALQLPAGEPARFETRCPRCGTLRVHQRIQRFPGTQGQRVLVELEIFQISGARMSRLVAPTLGLWLGEAQTSSFTTDIGTLEIRARVEGVGALTQPTADVDTFPADRDLTHWLHRPLVPVPII